MKTGEKKRIVVTHPAYILSRYIKKWSILNFYYKEGLIELNDHYYVSEQLAAVNGLKWRYMKEEDKEMKQPKKATRANKELMSRNGLVADNWMVVSEDKEKLVVISKRSQKKRTLMK